MCIPLLGTAISVAATYVNGAPAVQQQFDAHSARASSPQAGSPDLEAICPIVLSLPSPISERNLERYFAILSFSEAQASYIRRIHDQYLEDSRRLRQEHVPDLVANAKPLAQAFERGEYDPHQLALLVTWKEDELGLREALLELDERFLQQMQAISADVQLPAMARVRLHRARVKCTLTDVQIPCAKLDLVRLIEQLPLDDMQLKMLDPVTFEYERAVTPLFVELDELLNRAATRSVEIFVSRHFDDAGNLIPNDSPERGARRIRSDRARDEMLAEPARLQRELVTLNTRWRERLSAVLPNEVSAQFRILCLTHGYPIIFPDDHDPERLYLEVRQSAWLTQDDVASIETLWLDYRRGYDDVSQAMCDEYDRWKERLAQTQSLTNYAGYADTMRKLRDQRWERSEALLGHLLGRLPPEFLDRGDLRSDLVSWQNRIRMARDMGVADRFPPP
jgi:hypothetical protein